MSTVEESAIAPVDHETAAHHDATHDGALPRDSLYVAVAAVLFGLTALEVSTYYIDYGPLFLPLLFVLMAIKFVLVVLFFMHLRFDAKIFGRLFWAGAILAVVVYVTALATFELFIQ
jgi:cytochrome c oxidase subunit 4